jgi:prevent-host-death family protein
MAVERRQVGMRQVAITELNGRLAEYLRLAEEEEIVITEDGRPVGVLVGFESEDDWFDYCLESDPRFLARVAKARCSLRSGAATRIEDIEELTPSGR